MGNLPKWVYATAAAIAAAVGEYWAQAPSAMQVAAQLLPVVAAADLATTAAHARCCEGVLRPGDRWQAVLVRACLTTLFFVLGFSADAVGGLGYSFAPLALLTGYSLHVASIIRHARVIAAAYQIPPPGWLSDIQADAERRARGDDPAREDGDGS